ncbi:uncharacterized protein LOC110931518 [Helianthus annuus]|uniref:uncharacterized protein LOC110931518 n=1 Tax=Helianthus annuus TaxID=4232 RepID=UPI000B906B15|nr:uncharacterized protein LOC110931518 [Helianthus annuus]
MKGVWGLDESENSIFLSWFLTFGVCLFEENPYGWLGSTRIDYEIGDGSSTSAWFDYWCVNGPLCTSISPREIARAGFTLQDTVADVSIGETWNWPEAWRNLFPVLIHADAIQRNLSVQDQVLWMNGNKLHEFSSSEVWNSIRSREPQVDWVNVVWFSQCIPRHAFLMWLIMRRKLLTQDRILRWGADRRRNMNMMCCLLCYENFDSHEHLFFECKFSAQVWRLVRDKPSMSSVQPKRNLIVEWLSERARSKTAANFICRLIVAASAYIIWQERNNRLFRNHARPPDIVADAIVETIRYKLMGTRFKKTPRVMALLQEWEVQEGCLDDNGG